MGCGCHSAVEDMSTHAAADGDEGSTSASSSSSSGVGDEFSPRGGDDDPESLLPASSHPRRLTCECRNWRGDAWLQALPMLRAFPQAARELQPYGCLPLFLAAMTSAPPQVVEALLEAHPTAASVSFVDGDGLLPLHAAAGAACALVSMPRPTPATAEVFRLLLDAFPSAASTTDNITSQCLPLHYAVQNNSSLTVVGMLLSAHHEGLQHESQEGLPLHAAVANKGSLEVIKALLAASPNTIRERRRTGEYALHIAVEEGAEDEVIMLLLDAFPEAASEHDSRGMTPLHLAAQSSACSMDILQALLDADRHITLDEDEMGATPLLYAALFGNLGFVQQLLEAEPIAAEQPCETGDYPLDFASMNGHAEIVSALLGAYPEALSSSTVHHAAAVRKNAQAIPDLVEVLLAADADIAESLNDKGCTPLHTLAANSLAPAKAFDLLLSKCPALPAQKDKTGRMPLHHVASVTATKLILKANPEAASEADAMGRLPLHWAVSNKEATLEMIQLLLDANASAAGSKDAKGLLPLHLACEAGMAEEVHVMLVAAYPQAAAEPDGSRQLPIHWAAGASGMGAVQTLLQAHPGGGAAPDGAGRLPLHWAAKAQAAPEVIREILQAYSQAAWATDKDANLPLHAALVTTDKEVNLEVVNALLYANRSAATQINSSGLLPLHLAVRSLGRIAIPLEVVRAVLEASPAAVSEFTAAGDLPLHHAMPKDLYRKGGYIAEPDPEVVKLLVEADAGAATKLVGSEQELPLHLAFTNSMPLDVLKLLLQCHPEAAMVPNQLGELPLHCAVARIWTCDKELVQELLAANPAAVSVKDSGGNLPLHLAAKTRAELEVIGLLLAANKSAAAVKLDNEDLPIHLLLRQQVPANVVEHVLKSFPDAAAVEGCDGTLPLCQAAETQSLPEVIKVLLEANLKALEAAPAFQDLHAPLLADMVMQNPKMAKITSPSGISWVDRSTDKVKTAVRTALQFLGRYSLTEGRPAHCSTTSVVVFATDVKAPDPSDKRLALKLMCNREHFLRELQARAVEGISNGDSVVPILRVYLEDNDDELDAGLAAVLCSRGMKFHTTHTVGGCVPLEVDLPNREAFRYCLVMPQGEHDLAGVLAHQQIAGCDWDRIRLIGRELGTALALLHSSETIHGDFKPLNVVRTMDVWHLIDMDASCPIGGEYGVKCPSSAYSPPELGKALLEAQGDSTKLQGHIAGVAHDFWSFGVVLLHMCTGKRLWHADEYDSLGASQLQQLHNWDLPACRSLLEGHGLQEGDPSYDLLLKLLHPDPSERTRPFQGQMLQVVSHPFLSPSQAPSSLLLLTPSEQTKQRLAEAHDLLRSPVPARNAPEGGFLIIWSKAMFEESEVSKLADDKLLERFRKHLGENCNLDELADETANQIKFQAHLSLVLKKVRNYSSHFNEINASSPGMPIHRRHARYVLHSYALFFEGLHRLADNDSTGIAACHGSQLTKWAYRCAELWREQCQQDLQEPFSDDPMLLGIDRPCQELWDLAFERMYDAKEAQKCFKSKQTYSPISKFSPSDLSWLDDLCGYLRRKSGRSITFNDEAWGLILMEELLDGLGDQLPPWAWAKPKGCCSTSDDEMPAPREAELFARVAIFLGADPNTNECASQLWAYTHLQTAQSLAGQIVAAHESAQ